MRRLALTLCLLSTPAFATDYNVGDTVTDPMQIAQAAFDSFPYGEEGRPGVSVDVSTDFWGAMTILVANTGGAGDSVAGVRDQYVLNPSDGTWTVTFAERQYLCSRGANTVTWQTGLCP